MNILITGCNGQLGNEIQLLEKETPQHAYFNTDVSELDITDRVEVDRFVQEKRIDGIVNCAAYTAVDKAEDCEQLCSTLNAEAPAYLAMAVEKRGGWLVHISTDYVFDGTKHTPYVETDTPCPDSVYGRTKLAGELAAQEYCKKTMIIRTAWLYSAFGNNFVKTMIRLGNEKDEIGVVFDQIGTPTYARDLAVAVMTAIGKGIVPGTYNFSDEGVASWYDFTKTIHRMAGITTCHVKPLHTEDYPASANRPHYSVLDKTKFKTTYGVEIPYWEDSLRECIGRLQEM